MKYLNMKTAYGIETVDEVRKEDFESYREFKLELHRLVGEYILSGMDVYVSSRCSKCWKD